MLNAFTKTILEAFELQVNEQCAQEPCNLGLISLLNALDLEKRGFIFEAATLYRTVEHPIASHRLQLIAFNPHQMPPAPVLTFLPRVTVQPNSPVLPSLTAKSSNISASTMWRDETALANQPLKKRANIYKNRIFDPRTDPLKLLHGIYDLWQKFARSPNKKEMMDELNVNRYHVDLAMQCLMDKEWIEESRAHKAYTITTLGNKQLQNSLLKQRLPIPRNLIDLTVLDTSSNSPKVTECVRTPMSVPITKTIIPLIFHPNLFTPTPPSEQQDNPDSRIVLKYIKDYREKYAASPSKVNIIENTKLARLIVFDSIDFLGKQGYLVERDGPKYKEFTLTPKGFAALAAKPEKTVGQRMSIAKLLN